MSYEQQLLRTLIRRKSDVLKLVHQVKWPLTANTSSNIGYVITNHLNVKGNLNRILKHELKFAFRKMLTLKWLIVTCKAFPKNYGPRFGQSKINRLHYSPTQYHAHEETGDTRKQLTVKLNFDDIKNKNKDTYLDMVKIYLHQDVNRRGHVEFIYSAMKHMKQFNVHKDLEVYKALIDVLPKGKFIPRNIFQAEFMHYPKQQQCIIDLLEQMEDNGVMPDPETESILLNIFGRRGYPLRKFWRIMYWMPKFKNLSPWPVRNPPPEDTFELAQMAISRISSVDVETLVSIYNTSDVENSQESTWIVSAQSPTQRRLITEHDPREPIYIEGPFKVWLRNKCVDYFTLKSNPNLQIEDNVEDLDDVSNIKWSPFNFKPPKQSYLTKAPSVHEQSDGIILSVCATGTSSRNSLLSWIRCLEGNGNPVLNKMHIVFTLKVTDTNVTIANETRDESENEDC